MTGIRALAPAASVALGIAVVILVWFPLQIPQASPLAGVWSLAHDVVVGLFLIAGMASLSTVVRRRGSWFAELPLVYLAVCMASVLPLVVIPTLGLAYARMQWVTLATYGAVYLCTYAVSRWQPAAILGIVVALFSWTTVSAIRTVTRAWVTGSMAHDLVDAMGHTNSRAGFEVVAGLFLLGAMGHRWKASLLAGIPILAFLLASLGLSLSRGAWLGFLAGVAAAVGLRWGWRRATVVMVVAVLLLLLLPGPFGQRARTVVDAGFETNLFRLTAWREAVRVIGENPWGGAGYDTLWFALLSRLGSDVSTLAGKHVHNLALQTWAETGLFGIVALSCIFAAMLRLAVRVDDPGARWVRPVGRGIAICLTGMIAHGLVDCTWRDYGQQIVFWGLAGWLSAVGGQGSGRP